MHKRLYINTIGCQMNVYDSERIVNSLIPLGYETTPFIESADLIITNTCTIREKAEQKAFSFLGACQDSNKKNANLIIAVGGCVAQQQGRKILKRMPHVDLVFGTHALGDCPRPSRKSKNSVAGSSISKCRSPWMMTGCSPGCKGRSRVQVRDHYAGL